MSKLVDMKYTKAEIKEETAELKSYSPPEYPWGLQIRLEDDELNKLGVKGLPEIGAEYHLQVIAKVQSASQTSMADGKTDRCVCLQVTMIGIDLQESAADEKKERRETPASEAAETKAKSKTVMEKY